LTIIDEDGDEQETSGAILYRSNYTRFIEEEEKKKIKVRIKFRAARHEVI